MSFTQPKETPLYKQKQEHVALSSAWFRRDRYGPVQYGDSLSEIAYRLRKDKRWSNHQIMLALFDKNPEAFRQHNINALKKGSVLKVPSGEEVQAFVGSERFLALQKFGRKKKIQSVEKLKPEPSIIQASKASKASKFRGKISLGLSKDAVVQKPNPLVMASLAKLEPLYQQAMAANLQMDSLGGKVDSLAAQVSMLHKKIDALSALKQSNNEDVWSAGWLGFFVLLLLNILLFVAYFYRKKMFEWQAKLLVQQQSSVRYKTPASPMDVANDDKTIIFKAAKQSADRVVQAERAKKQEDMASTVEGSIEDERAQYMQDFEHAIIRKDWVQAEKSYQNMGEKNCENPRVQALLIQKLHGEGDIVARNTALMTLFKLYDNGQWHRFCSYFDEAIWHILQEQKVIDFTGNVVALEVARLNAAALNPHVEESVEPETSMLDLSDTRVFDLSLDDLDVEQVEPDMRDDLAGDTDPSLEDIDDAVFTSVPPGQKKEIPEPDLSIDEGLVVDFELDFSVLEEETSQAVEADVEDDFIDPDASTDEQLGMFDLELDIPNLELTETDTQKLGKL